MWKYKQATFCKQIVDFKQMTDAKEGQYKEISFKSVGKWTLAIFGFCDIPIKK